ARDGIGSTLAALSLIGKVQRSWNLPRKTPSVFSCPAPVIGSAAVAHEALFAALKHPLDATDFDDLGQKYKGKVRDCYSTDDGRRIIVVTDRISAFDRGLGVLPLK